MGLAVMEWAVLLETPRWLILPVAGDSRPLALNMVKGRRCNVVTVGMPRIHAHGYTTRNLH